MKNTKFFYFFLLLLTVIMSCELKDDVDTEKELLNNMSFRQLIPTTAYATASSIIVSPNEKYMLFFNEGKSFYSKDAGQTIEELFLYGEADGIPINISNDGKFIFGGGLYNLNTIGQGSAAINYASGVTESGKLIYIQNEEGNGNTFFIENNGSYESTGVKLEMDLRFYLGTSGEKLGFFDWQNKTIAEFDVSSLTYTQTVLSDLDYSRLYGNGTNLNRVKTAYSYGNFALAKEGGVILISPEHNIMYNEYPEDYRIWQNTEGGLKLFGSTAYVNIYDRWGKLQVHKVSENMVEAVEHSFEVYQVGHVIYTQGFIEI